MTTKGKYFAVKNLEKFQHYRDRNPPWIKLHKTVFTDYEFSCLQDASKLHLILIWLLASQLDNKIPYDPEWLKQQIHIKGKVDLKPLFEKGFLVNSKPLADSEQDATTETEAYKEETETETTLSGKPDLSHDVLDYLNKRAGRKFRDTPKHRKLIQERVKEEYVLEDFKRVVDNMVAKWGNDGKMVEFLRPITLFGTKFDSYLNINPKPNNGKLVPPPQSTQAELKAEIQKAIWHVRSEQAEGTEMNFTFLHMALGAFVTRYEDRFRADPLTPDERKWFDSLRKDCIESDESEYANAV